MIEIIVVIVVGWFVTNPARKERKRIDKAINERTKELKK